MMFLYSIRLGMTQLEPSPLFWTNIGFYLPSVDVFDLFASAASLTAVSLMWQRVNGVRGLVMCCSKDSLREEPFWSNQCLKRRGGGIKRDVERCSKYLHY